jgi:hypothetical protein
MTEGGGNPINPINCGAIAMVGGSVDSIFECYK